MRTKEDILAHALELVSKDRNITHGDAYEQLTQTANLWSVFLKRDITAEQVCVCMCLMKISRTTHGKYNPDDYNDLLGYGAIAGECADRTAKNFVYVEN